MIPIWAKDINGKWQVFPGHLIETFPDGKRGVSDSLCSSGLWPYELTMKWSHLFTYDKLNCRSLLREKT